MKALMADLLWLLLTVGLEPTNYLISITISQYISWADLPSWLWYYVYFWICPSLHAFRLPGCNKANLNIHERKTKIIKLSQQHLFLLSNNIENIKGKTPSDFARLSRRLDELKRSKAKEFHQFLLYTGLVF